MKGLSNAAIADGHAGLSLRCRGHIRDGKLTAPFWLQFDHFDPAHSPSRNTPAKAARAYRRAQHLRGFQHHRVHIAYADYTNMNGRLRPTVAVWIVVRYGVLGASYGLLSKPMRVDEVAILNDADLRPRGVILTLPSRCQ